MNIQLFDNLTNPSLLDQVWKLLVSNNKTFIPPLSARESTSQSNLSQQTSILAEPKQYFENLKKQAFLIALNQDKQVLGFMSFRKHYICEELNDEVDTLYISTIIVDENFRGQGITTRFYSEIEKLAQLEHRPITTRTWSTNYSHIHVLKKLGFYEALIVENGRGNGIDTVYFRKTI